MSETSTTMTRLDAKQTDRHIQAGRQADICTSVTLRSLRSVTIYQKPGGEGSINAPGKH